MRQRFQARQSEEATGALDRMNEAKDIIENLALFGSCSNRTN